MELLQPLCDDVVTHHWRAWVLGNRAESPIHPRTSCYINDNRLKNLSLCELGVLFRAAESVRNV